MMLHKSLLNWTLVSLLIILTTTCAHADPIRIGLNRYHKYVKQITVLASSHFAFYKSGTTEKLASFTNLTPATLEVVENTIILKRDTGETAELCESITIVPNDPNSLTSIDSPGRPFKQYRGRIEVNIHKGYLQLVNTIEIEDYLLGVVPDEMPSIYPLEALKAQAVAARTYTLGHLGKHRKDGYDLCDKTCCQVYGGAISERTSTTQAVKETEGIVLKYGSQLASTLYCGNCGGISRDFQEAFGGKNPIPYLRAGIQDACEPRAWELKMDLAELADKLVKAGITEAQGLTNIQIKERACSKRVICIELTGLESSTSITGQKLRTIIGNEKMMSTLFDVEICPEECTVIFKGKGYGHGVGMCQNGAREWAKTPHNYTFDQILSHYYPGTILYSTDGKKVANTPKPHQEKTQHPMVRKGDSKPVAAPAKAAQPGPKSVKTEINITIRLDAPELP